MRAARPLGITIVLAAFMAATVLLTTNQVALADGPIVYVDRDAPGTADGSSWTNAYTNLQDALDATIPGDEIWVAEGIYTPTNTIGQEATIQLVSGVPLYGGFGGYGISETLRSQRNWTAYATVLSGDLDGNDFADPNGVVTGTANITGTNAYHVVTGSGVTETAVLDGFTVTGGQANGSYPYNVGGGMYNDYGDPTLSNVTFSGNTANSSGGGMRNNYSNPTLSNVTFSGNHANNSGGGMCNSHSDPMLSNVTFSGNHADTYGGGMYNRYSHPTLSNVTFSGNHANYNGGGIFNSSSNPMLTSVTFSGNHANNYNGGGMCNYNSHPTLINVTFSGNHADDGGGMYNYNSSNPTLINVTFSGNHANYNGGGMYNSSSNPTLINVTFSGNHANYNGGGMYNYNSNPTLNNCILWGNTASNESQIYGGASINFSLVEGGHSGAGNLNADPRFVDADGPDDVTGTLDDNLRLLPTSPTIDAGDNSAVPTDTLDLDGDDVITEPLPFDPDGNPRFVDVPSRPDTGSGTPPIVDMGAFEANPRDLWITKAVIPTTPRAPGDAITFTLVFVNSATSVATGVVITDVVPAEVTGLGVISSGVAITRVMGVGYAWTVQDLAPDEGGVITITGVISPDLTVALNLTNTAVITTTAVDTDTTNNMGRVQTHVPGIIYVDAGAPGAADGSSWINAYTNLQDALDAAIPGDELWVAEGIYTPTNTAGREATFQLVDGVALYGGFGGYGISETQRSHRDWTAHVTVLSGDLDGNDATDPDGVATGTANITGTNTYHVVTGSGVAGTAVLDGLTITGGQANGSHSHKYGGGMYNTSSNPTLTNVTFSGNHADLRGGGMYNYNSSNPTLSNVTFSSNHADDHGGGMYNYNSSDPTLTNVTFSGNTASAGAGMCNYNSSDPTLTNVTFSGNHANIYGGGMYNYGSSSPTLTNVTFSGNHANSNGGGMFNWGSNPTLSNCILWGNTAPNGPQIYNYGSTPTVTYSLVESGHNGASNRDADPQFVDADGPDDIVGTLDDNLHLLSPSPAIDAGNNAAIPADVLDLDSDGVITEPIPFDLDGNPRFVDTQYRPDTGNGVPPIVDMGVYEYNRSPKPIQI